MSRFSYRIEGGDEGAGFDCTVTLSAKDEDDGWQKARAKGLALLAVVSGNEESLTITRVPEPPLEQ